MNCPHCGNDTNGKTVGFCPHCGALLGLTQPSDTERRIDPPLLAQKQAIIPATIPQSPGPLLTGRVVLDSALGFLGEVVALALLVYAIWQFIVLQNGSHSGLVPLIGMVATAVFLFWYTKVMRVRYPAFSQGWKTGRKTWGVGMEHLLTLVFGVLMLAVLFPLGGLLICLGVQFGPIAWIAALFIAYLFGNLARRMSTGNKKPQGPRP